LLEDQGALEQDIAPRIVLQEPDNGLFRGRIYLKPGVPGFSADTSLDTSGVINNVIPAIRAISAKLREMLIGAPPKAALLEQVAAFTTSKLKNPTPRRRGGKHIRAGF
jgi:hypothetical protein